MIKKKCFVISPIGAEKSETRGHADDVLEFIILPAMKKFKQKFDIDIDAVRADHIQSMGQITKQMFEAILGADLCVAILTEHNPNVFYELAVAQAAARPAIILLEKGQEIPFDIKDLRVVHYALQPITQLIKGVYADEVYEYVKAVHQAGWSTPSLFETYGYGQQPRYEQQLRAMNKTARPEPLPSGQDKVYTLPFDSNRHIEIVKGDLKQLGDLQVDTIASLETIDLQLARFYDPCISGTLRYLDALKTKGGNILEDSLNEQLQAQIRKQGHQMPLVPGSVVATPTNQLAQLGIKYVFHIAAMQGSIGDGYRTMDFLIDDCIRNVYSQFADLAQKNSEIKTILFPILGAATSELDLGELTERLLQTIADGMKKYPSCKKTYLLAWIEPHLHAVHIGAERLGLKEVSSRNRKR